MVNRNYIIYLANRRQQQKQHVDISIYYYIPKVENYESNEIKITIRPISSSSFEEL